jgi:UDP-2,4-diacetamido-2,4,6-trideoxy-beta-L-altropyranose hydrolase
MGTGKMIYIRADANADIGMGHVMRCLSIADAASTMGVKSTFVLADREVESLVNDRGYKTVVLHSDYSGMEEEEWPEIQAGLIIVDSYNVTQKYFRKVRKHGPIAYMDDLATFPYAVDILINYNIYAPSLDYHSLYAKTGISEPYMIIGPSYVPLRKMFQGQETRKQNKDVRHILISTGGADPEHLALKILQSKPDKYSYHFLLGQKNADKDAIKEVRQGNIILHEDVSDMKSLICGMDIAVSAAGSTLYEICSCGVPLITYVLADNQIPGANAFGDLGLAVNLGDLRNNEDPGGMILSAVEDLAAEYEQRVEMGTRMQSMMDGFGASRMVTKIIGFMKGDPADC